MRVCLLGVALQLFPVEPKLLAVLGDAADWVTFYEGRERSYTAANLPCTCDASLQLWWRGYQPLADAPTPRSGAYLPPSRAGLQRSRQRRLDGGGAGRDARFAARLRRQGERARRGRLLLQRRAGCAGAPAPAAQSRLCSRACSPGACW